MDIILMDDFVAGVFENWDNTRAYIEARPSTINEFIVIHDDLYYPFFILQLANGAFTTHQLEDDALENESGRILFEISQDYLPAPAWSDQMGSLPHGHLDEED